MIPLVWYSGLEKDKAAILDGKGVVLYADSTVCRVLSFTQQKICLIGYPSCVFLHVMASDNDSIFNFNDRDYCLYPSYCYKQIKEDDEDELIYLYRRFCETKSDPSFQDFISTYRESEDASMLSLEDDIWQMAIIIAYHGTILGKITFRFRVKPVDDIDYEMRVVEFNKKKFIDDIYQLMVAYGNPPVLTDVKNMVENILLDYAKQLKVQRVEFDPSLFDE